MLASCPVSRTELLLSVVRAPSSESCPWQEDSTTEILATLESPSLGAGAVQFGGGRSVRLAVQECVCGGAFWLSVWGRPCVASVAPGIPGLSVGQAGTASAVPSLCLHVASPRVLGCGPFGSLTPGQPAYPPC